MSSWRQHIKHCPEHIITTIIIITIVTIIILIIFQSSSSSLSVNTEIDYALYKLLTQSCTVSKTQMQFTEANLCIIRNKFYFRRSLVGIKLKLLKHFYHFCLNKPDPSNLLVTS